MAKHAKVITAQELELLSPDERARLVREHEVSDLSSLDAAFRKRVEDTGRQLLEERGVLQSNRSDSAARSSRL